jgi:hypothetical protein
MSFSPVCQCHPQSYQLVLQSISANDAVEAAGACVAACFLLGFIVPYLLFLKSHHCRRTFDKSTHRATNVSVARLYMPR